MVEVVNSAYLRLSPLIGLENEDSHHTTGHFFILQYFISMNYRSNEALKPLCFMGCQGYEEHTTSDGGETRPVLPTLIPALGFLVGEQIALLRRTKHFQI